MDYDLGEVVNTFENHNAPDKGVSRLCLLNELDDSLLLVASSKSFVYFSCTPLATALASSMTVTFLSKSSDLASDTSCLNISILERFITLLILQHVHYIVVTIVESQLSWFCGIDL